VLLVVVVLLASTRLVLLAVLLVLAAPLVSGHLVLLAAPLGPGVPLVLAVLVAVPRLSAPPVPAVPELVGLMLVLLLVGDLPAPAGRVLVASSSGRSIVA
jgi:hypothetical protein